jgi:hypothetical protein
VSRAVLGISLAAALATSACGHLETHEVSLRAPSAPAAQDADIYFDGRWPDRAFYEVALIQVVGFGTNANPEDVTRALALRGRQNGCDAVVRVRVDQGYARANGFGVCVRYSPVQTVAPAQAPAPGPAPSAPEGAPL